MALHDLPRKLTYDDYVLIPEDGQRHEILDGEHYVGWGSSPRRTSKGRRTWLSRSSRRRPDGRTRG